MPRGKERLVRAHVGAALSCWAPDDRGDVGIQIHKWYGLSPSRTPGLGTQNKWSHCIEQIRAWQEAGGGGWGGAWPGNISVLNEGKLRKRWNVRSPVVYTYVFWKNRDIEGPVSFLEQRE